MTSRPSIGTSPSSRSKPASRTRSIASTVQELESLKFGISELLAIYAAHAALVGITGTPIHDDLQAVTTKIRGLLSKLHNGGLEALVRVFAPHPRGTVDYTAQSELIDDLSDAIARRRVCELTYRAPGKKADRTHRAPVLASNPGLDGTTKVSPPIATRNNVASNTIATSHAVASNHAGISAAAGRRDRIIGNQITGYGDRSIVVSPLSVDLKVEGNQIAD